MGTVFRLPTVVHMGSGVAGLLLDRVRELGGSRAFVVTDPGVRDAGLVERVLAPLEAEGIAVDIWDGISSNPRDYECNNAAEQAIAFESDLVVAIGGGSPIDAAKAV